MGKAWTMASVLLLVFVLPVLVATRVSAVPCPGGEFSCPSHMTCCPLANEHYGCCPFPDATCCSDHVHCCPHDMKCDVAHQACLKDGSPLKFMWQVKVHAEMVSVAEEGNSIVEDGWVEGAQPNPIYANQLEDVTVTGVEKSQCPDGHECPGSYTCCKMYRGDYGCCPYREATCCSDGFHCCPHGSRCDETTGGCYNEMLNRTEVHLLKKVVPQKDPRKKTRGLPVIGEVTDPAPGTKCPDGHPCPAKSTCCKVVDRGYGCCPYENGVCCDDLIHCCPHGTVCNASTATCDQHVTLRSVPSYSLLTGKLSEAAVQLDDSRRVRVNGMCPDRRSQCPDGNTCCKLRDGSYGCCPLPEATCCSDHVHCCPRGYSCRGSACYRDNGDNLIPDIFWNAITNRVRPEPSRHEETEKVESEDVVCPDHQSRCPDGRTCCEISSGGYGCCPFPEATCCGDKLHCCPHGYWCAEEGCERLPSTVGNLLPPLDKVIIRNSTKVHHRPHHFHMP